MASIHLQRKYGLLVLVFTILGGAPAQGAFLVEIDTDGKDDGAITFNTNFAFGGDTTTAAIGGTVPAVGLTGGDSIFGGDGVNEVDTYRYFYSPESDGDNLPLAGGTPLNNDGHAATGNPAGGSGLYNIYATWSRTNNVSGGDTRYTLFDQLDQQLFSVLIDQNTRQDNEGDGAGDEWIFLAQAELDAAGRYRLIQQSQSNTFVSMRSAGVLFDAVPEPTSAALVGLGGLALLLRRRARTD